MVGIALTIKLKLTRIIRDVARLRRRGASARQRKRKDGGYAHDDSFQIDEQNTRQFT
jgi:hypothetical protein